MQKIHHLINGQSVPSTSGRTSAVFNPATGEQTAELGLASVEEVNAAVAAAKTAFATWSTMSLARRTKIMFNFRSLVEANVDEIARRLTMEHGKVLSDAAGEVARGLENIEYACGIAELLKGSYNMNASTGVDVYTVRQPLGVVAGITPFNFPAMVPLWTIPNAIACGNTYVLKPSEKDPSAPAVHRRAVPRGRTPRRSSQCGAWRQSCRRPFAGTPRCEGCQLRWFHPHRQVRL